MADKKRLGVMLDCSRNGVMKVSAVKNYIDTLKKMGYNMLMLYTEDTYEVEGRPFFGYLRGRYSVEEMTEIVEYGESKGVELIPCIQTLAHLNQIFRWGDFAKINDTGDILLVDDEETYSLIEDMFKTLRKCFKTDYLHIGMDEAHFVGLGKYLTKHGFCNRFDILSRHLKRVSDLAEKYGFKSIMWSDMFFRLAADGAYYINDPEIITDDIVKCVPENVELTYWDYYASERDRYDNMIAAHKRFNKPVWFGGGAWKWSGFSPDNGVSIMRTKEALISCREAGVENVFITCWGDDGAEAPYLSVLPTLFYAAEVYRGNDDMKDIKQKFEKMFNIGFDDFCMLDLPSRPKISTDVEFKGVINRDKFMLYNDPFLGIYDLYMTDVREEVKYYKSLSRKLKRLCDHEEFGYMFRAEKALCDLLAVKYDLGRNTLDAYKKGDKNALLNIAKSYKKAIKLIDVFIKEFRESWVTEKKPHGFDVQDIRLGGLRQRLVICRERIIDYVNGKVDVIEELEEERLLVGGCCHNNWAQNASINVI